ncbi:hypothetical protein KFK09_020739 [Dendrobium nobile]|uniref:Uncharacterized protein n=1 Tax=Dendrobium nobile TaxID=94219 RepID=A0A8T3AN86_DENNO|nr:hypothetical protein KFK09_020739 [Dendrobium nobile]
MQDVYKIIYDTHGQYWPYIHHYIIITIVLMQLTMIGLFGLKSKPGASVSTVALVLLTVLFNEYCKIRFLPSFQHRPIQRQFIPLILRLPRKWMIKNWRVRLKGIKLLLLSMLIVLLGCVRWLFKHQAPSSLWFQLNTLRSAPCSILGFFSRLLCLSKLATIYVCDSQQGLNSYANHSNV